MVLEYKISGNNVKYLRLFIKTRKTGADSLFYNWGNIFIFFTDHKKWSNILDTKIDGSIWR